MATIPLDQRLEQVGFTPARIEIFDDPTLLEIYFYTARDMPRIEMFPKKNYDPDDVKEAIRTKWPDVQTQES